MVEAQQRIRTQRALRQLDVHLLRDIGVDPIDIGKPSQQARQFLVARIYLGGAEAEHLYERQQTKWRSAGAPR